MRSNQSNRASALLVDWAPDGAGPAHHRLAAALRAEIGSGRLRPGERLPPTRALAEELGVSRWVVTECYDQLKAEGHLTSLVGSGTRVSERSASAAANPAPAARTAQPGAPRTPPSLDLSPALPDLASFPRPAWRAAVTRALSTASDHALGYPDPAGAPELRSTMAGYLRRVRGLDVDPDTLHVTQGVRNAVSLLCRQLRAAGATRVAVEDPSWPRMREVARAGGLEVVAVPVDALGMQVDTLVELDRRCPIDAVFVTPTHQFPTGVPLSAQRRRALVGWAAAGGRLVVEDDYDAEFRYDRRPVGALAALAPDHVAYVGSVSKTLSPALHLGWMVVPPGRAESVAAQREAVGALAPTLDQLALAHLIESGAYDRHLRRMRRSYRQRRAALLAALDRHAGGAPAQSMDAGLHVLWQLPDGCSEHQVLDRCRAAGLAVLGLSQCRVAPGPAGLVLGSGNIAEHRAADVARVVGEAISASAGQGGR